MPTTCGKASAITSRLTRIPCRRRSSVFGTVCGQNATLITSYEMEMAVNILNGAARTRFEAQLPSILRAQRWFGGKARHITSAQIIDRMVIPLDEMQTVLLLIDV